MIGIFGHLDNFAHVLIAIQKKRLVYILSLLDIALYCKTLFFLSDKNFFPYLFHRYRKK